MTMGREAASKAARELRETRILGAERAARARRASVAARIWSEVTGGAGVALVDGKPVDVPRKRGRPGKGA
jgi:hypothetical protein